MYSVNQRRNGFIIEIYIGNGGKQAVDDQFVRIFRNGFFIFSGSPGKPDQRAGQSVLKQGGIGLFAAYSCISGAAGASGRLFTLKTKHLICHNLTSLT